MIKTLIIKYSNYLISLEKMGRKATEVADGFTNESSKQTYEIYSTALEMHIITIKEMIKDLQMIETISGNNIEIFENTIKN